MVVAPISGPFGNGGKKSAPMTVRPLADQELLNAASGGNTNQILGLLNRAQKPNLDAKDDYGNTAVHILTGFNGQNYTDSLRLLLNAPGVNPNIKGHQDDTPLHAAIKYKNAAAVQLLLAHPQIDLTATTKVGGIDYTPIALAEAYEKMTPNSNLRPIIKMLEAKQGVVALHKAIEEGDKSAVDKLLENDLLDRNAYYNGKSPIHAAITKVISAKGDTAEIADNRVKIIEALLNDPKFDGKTLDETLKIPGMAKALTTAMPGPGGYASEPPAKMAQMVMAKYSALHPNAAPTAQDEEALHIAIKKPDLKEVQYYLNDKKVSVNAKLLDQSPIMASIMSFERSDTPELTDTRLKIAAELLKDPKISLTTKEGGLSSLEMAQSRANGTTDPKNPFVQVASMVTQRAEELQRQSAPSTDKNQNGGSPEVAGNSNWLIPGAAGAAGVVGALFGSKWTLPLIAGATIAGIAVFASAPILTILALGGGAAAVAYFASDFIADKLVLKPPSFANTPNGKDNANGQTPFQQQLREADEQAARGQKGDLQAAAQQYRSGDKAHGSTVPHKVDPQTGRSAGL